MKELLQCIINCCLLCIVPIMNSATICRTTLPAGAGRAEPVSSEDGPGVGVPGRLRVTGDAAHTHALTAM